MVGGVAYTAIAQHVTTVEETYTGPPAAAFTTLRREGSIKFKQLLQRLENPLLHIASPRLELDLPQPTGPIQDLERAELQGESPIDSAIDVQTPTWSVLTPAWSALSFSNDTQQPDQQDEIMAPVREIGLVERERRRERNQQVEVVSGKQSKPDQPQLSSTICDYFASGRLTPTDSLKDVIHNYYEVQAQVHGYLSETETRDVLANKMQEISQSLDHLARESSSTTITNTFVPPEVVDYVDDGRNPDIYTRDLVEVVQRGNAVLNGKMNAFGSFSKIFADDLRKMSPEMAKAVDEIMDGGAGDGTMAVDVKQENGGTGHQE
jgi:mediator of RNA polymerase II transcription subunit 10